MLIGVEGDEGKSRVHCKILLKPLQNVINRPRSSLNCTPCVPLIELKVLENAIYAIAAGFVFNPTFVPFVTNGFPA